MAVEARHLNLFPSQLLGNREMMNPMEGNPNFYNTQIGVPTTIDTNSLLPMYGCADSKHMKSDSGLTCNYNNLPRKRPRTVENKTPSPFSFLGEDLSQHIHHHQSDIDRLVSRHMEKVRMEMEEKRKREGRRIVEVVESGVAKMLRAKEEEIEKMGKVNWALEERVKSLCVEKQIWRDLARTNEAAAHALRANIDQLLAQDAHSCCATTDHCRRTLCRNCGNKESCVLLLPCRHLCLCATCGSNLHTCPICKATNNASVHVNMS